MILYFTITMGINGCILDFTTKCAQLCVLVFTTIVSFIFYHNYVNRMFTNYIATFGKQFIVKSAIYRIVGGRVVVFNAIFYNIS
jgi:hypothetical protein